MRFRETPPSASSGWLRKRCATSSATPRPVSSKLPLPPNEAGCNWRFATTGLALIPLGTAAATVSDTPACASGRACSAGTSRSQRSAAEERLSLHGCLCRRVAMNRPRVLLADDHRIVAEGLKSLLVQEFELVGVVEDGRSMVEAAQLLRPDVIVADITMPHLNGIDALARLKKNDPDVKVVFL